MSVWVWDKYSDNGDEYDRRKIQDRDWFCPSKVVACSFSRTEKNELINGLISHISTRG